MKTQSCKPLRHMRIGYVPLSLDFRQPGDKRRFVFYARERKISFEVADPSENYDVVVLSQNADLSIWSKYDLGRAKVVFDFVDSYLAVPKTSIKGWMRGSAKFLAGQSRYLRFDHWKSLGDMCSRADAVICSTEEQSADISKICSNIHIILDAQTDVVRNVKLEYAGHQPFRLVWEGLPQNLESLKLLAPLLAQLDHEYAIELHIVTDLNFYRYLGKYWKVDTHDIAKKLNIPYVLHEWKETTCADIICACDLAVIPLDLDDVFARGKPENKLLLFWRMGIPVITSASPAYLRAMQAANLNLAAYDSGSWLENVSALIKDENARKQAGLLGKAYVARCFSSSALLARWDRMFESLGFTVS